MLCGPWGAQWSRAPVGWADKVISGCDGGGLDQEGWFDSGQLGPNLVSTVAVTSCGPLSSRNLSSPSGKWVVTWRLSGDAVWPGPKSGRVCSCRILSCGTREGAVQSAQRVCARRCVNTCVSP